MKEKKRPAEKSNGWPKMKIVILDRGWACLFGGRKRGRGA